MREERIKDEEKRLEQELLSKLEELESKLPYKDRQIQEYKKLLESGKLKELFE